MAWVIIDDKITNTDFIELPEKAMTKPYPKALWRCDPTVIDGLPYHELLPGISGIDMWAMERKDVISIYDFSEPQNGFDHNGLAILEPSECTSDKEFNGRWDITLTHPFDEWGKWTNILPMNVLKIRGQLFRIDETETVVDSSGEYITAHAKHITYDLADIWIDRAQINADTGTEYMRQLMTGRLVPNDREYKFDIFSDVSGDLQADVKDQTFIEALIGADDCFVNRFGGELYRDNFYLSLNKKMQYSRSNAFSLRYGANMEKISYKVDYSTWVTFLSCKNNFGHEWSISYDESTADWSFHHPISKRVYLSYPNISEDEAYARIDADGESYWETVCTPKITIEIKVANIKGDPKYADFLELVKLDVGDSGTIYFEKLKINTVLKIIAMKRDELTDEVISITLGNMAGSLIRPSYMGNTVSSGKSTAEKQLEAVREQLDELAFITAVRTPISTIDGKLLTTADGKFILYKG